MSKACRALPGSIWARCPNRTSTSSRGSARQSPYRRRPAAKVLARRWARSPRFTTICAYSTPRVGKGHCPQCGRPITAQSREQIIERIMTMPAGTRMLVLAPVVRGQKGEHRDLFDELRKQGFVRARVDGRVVHFAEELRLDRQMRHNIEVVIDRLEIGPKVRGRLAEAVELALKTGEGNLIVAIEAGEPPPKGKDTGGRVRETHQQSPNRSRCVPRTLPPADRRPTSPCRPITPARTAI